MACWMPSIIRPPHPLLPLLLLPSVFPSISVFCHELALHIRWPKYRSFSFSISPSNEHSRLISFRVDSFDLLAVQGTLKSLLQHHNLKASILWHFVFFMVQLSHPYMTTGKTIALTIQTFVGKVISLLFKMLSYRWLTTTWKDTQHHSLSEKWKSKPQWGTISHQSKGLLSKSPQTINAGEGVEKREHSNPVGGNAN